MCIFYKGHSNYWAGERPPFLSEFSCFRTEFETVWWPWNAVQALSVPVT